jgi:DNA-binding protein H-NS
MVSGCYNTREEDLALNSMPIDKLMELRNRVDAMLASKVANQRRTLQSELSKLPRVQPNGSGRIATSRGGVVAPKYRNPDNPAETWAGRGLKPRWMTAAMRRGGKLEDFLISAQAGPMTKGPRKARKARK